MNTMTPEQTLRRANEAFLSGDHEMAARLCNLVIAVEAGNLGAIKLLGRVRAAQKRWIDALMVLEQALLVNPNDAEILNDIGAVQKACGNFDAAAKNFERAREVDPTAAQIHYNLAVLHQRLERFDEALAGYQRALELQPNHADAWNNRGVIFQKLKEFDTAINNFRKALDCQPTHPHALLNLPLLHLLRGEYVLGWSLYENRWKIPQMAEFARPYSWPVWRGNRAAIRGKSVLIYAEQGLGDSISMCRYIPMVEALGAGVTVAVPESLVTLLRSLSPTVQVVRREEAKGPFDFQCAMMSLPLAFGTQPNSIPSRQRYLDPGDEKRALWAAKLGTKQRPRIGLAWAGNPNNPVDRERRVPFEMFSPLLEQPLEFHCLHQELRLAQGTQWTETRVRTWCNELGSFADTAGLIENMDCVVSVETSVAHLAGALGKPVWILISHVPDWRWQLDRDDSPWYPSARLFRQPRRGDWEQPLARIAKALQDQFSAK